LSALGLLVDIPALVEDAAHRPAVARPQGPLSWRSEGVMVNW
jgi:hypothetical protein